MDMKLSGVEYVIARAVLSDAGTYECQATNPRSAAVTLITVSVRSARLLPMK